jgi:hypothetical protein
MAGLARAEPETREVLKRAITHPLVRRLTVREYLPLAAWLSTWALLGLAFGHADAVRLFAANTFVQAIRNLCGLEMTATLAKRIGTPAFARSRSRALRYDLLVLLATIAVAALLSTVLWQREMAVPAAMIAIVALGVPARNPGGVLVVRRDREVPWRLGSSAASVVGAALVWKLGGEWWQGALVIAAREWVGLLATLLFAKPRAEAVEPLSTPLEFAELAGRTEAAARKRLTYRMAKSVLGGLLGPLGTVIARTGRGARLDARISNLIPRHRGGMALLTLISGGTMLFFLIVAREPSTLVLAAAAARIAASGGAALLWWNYGADLVDDEDDDDD